MNTVAMLIFLLNAAHTEPVSASVSFVSPATCAAYEAASEDDTVIVCETRAEVQHDLAGGRCTVNPVKPRAFDGSVIYICNSQE